MRRIEEYYLTGTLSIYSNRVHSPIILLPYYEHLLDEFLTEHNYGAKACHDASWTELYTKEEEALFAAKLA